jgi:hypothetical protein
LVGHNNRDRDYRTTNKLIKVFMEIRIRYRRMSPVSKLMLFVMIFFGTISLIGLLSSLSNSNQAYQTVDQVCHYGCNWPV